MLRRQTRTRPDSSRHPAVSSARLALALAVVTLVTWTGLLVGLLTLTGLLLATEVESALPPAKLDVANTVYQSSTVFAADGTTFLHEVIDPDVGQHNVVPLADMAPAIIEATIATEDASFYDHPGFDLRGLGRAGYEAFAEGRLMSGGSTITQQLARLVLLSRQESLERSFTRKLKEIILAYQLTRLYPKDRILELYLNEISYGNGANGIEAASRIYYDKRSRDLSLAEASFLAGLPQSPSILDPYVYPEAARQRQRDVLGRMYARGLVSADEAQALYDSTPPVQPYRFGRGAPHFVVALQEHVETLLGREVVRRGGLEIVSTLDSALQEQASVVVRETRDQRRLLGAHNLAVVALDPRSGEVRALIGSADFSDNSIAGQFDMTQVGRQPGTVVVPLIWASRLAAGHSLADRVDDQPFTVAEGIRRWQPENFTGGYHGRVPTRSAIHHLLVAPAVRALDRGGTRDLARFLADAGAPGLARQAEISEGIVVRGGRISPMELASAYATLAAGGVYREPTLIRRVTRDHAPISRPRTPEQQAIEPAIAYQILSALSHDVDDGDRAAVPSVINGRSEDLRDTWGIAVRPDLVVVVWLGNTNGERTTADARQLSASITGDIARRAGAPAGRFDRPANLVDAALCTDVDCRIRTYELIDSSKINVAQKRFISPDAPATSETEDTPVTTFGPAVPSVVGQRWLAAESALRLAGLVPVRQKATDDQVLGRLPASTTPGSVIATDPVAGQIVPLGSPVRVFLPPD